MGDGSHRALKLLETSGGRLHTLFVRVTLRADVADDLLQELFLKLSRAPGFAAADHAEAYAHRAALRLAFDWRRAQQRRALIPLADVDTDDGLPPLLATLATREEFDEVLSAMARLPTRAQQVLTMRFLEGHSYDEIAAFCGRSPHQARSICHKAITKLRSLVESDRAGAVRGKQSHA